MDASLRELVTSAVSDSDEKKYSDFSLRADRVASTSPEQVLGSEFRC